MNSLENEPGHWSSLTASQRETIGLVKQKLEINERQVLAALDILGEKDVPPEQRAARLVEIAQKLKDLQAIAAPQAGDGVEVAALKKQAQAAIDAGELPRADELLATTETKQRTKLETLAAETAATIAKRGEVALAQLEYSEAASRFAEAAATLPPAEKHLADRLGYLDQQAAALHKQGEELGDNAALKSEIELLRHILTFRPREHVPLSWAATQSSLGSALWKLGERESGTTRLEEAVAAYRAALEEQTRERGPLDWAATQNSLGNALATIGERQSGTVRLEEAVAAYRAALEENTRERVPLAWAKTQNNLGTALLSLGTALLSLGQRESGMLRLEEAVAAYRAALEERTRNRVPLSWAATQSSLGNALRVLGERESGAVRLGEAVAAYRAALEENTRERVPLAWATTYGNQGAALILMADRRADPKMARAALQQLTAAYDEMRNAGHAPAAAYYQARIPEALALIGRLQE